MKGKNFIARFGSQKEIALTRSRTDGVTVYELDVKHLVGEETLEISCPQLEAEAGEEGYYLVSGNEHTAGSALIRFDSRDADGELIVFHPTLNFYAVGKSDATYVVMVDYTYWFRFKVVYADGRYKIAVRIRLTEQPVADGITMRVLRLSAGADYNAVARAVREYRLSRGEIRTLSEKCAERECVEYIRSYPLVRIRMGWKPVPPEILHQTPENEPPMLVACTFERVRDIVREMKAQGVEGAEISLVGWNIKGHDGRWPQVFPVEEAFGGEEELKKTVEYVKSLGYMITCHTNSVNHYEIADTFDIDDIAMMSNGEPQTYGKWAGGLCYNACPEIQVRYAKRDLPRIAALGFKGPHYIDCITNVRPDVCFNPKHPSTLRNSIDCLREIMRLSQKEMGGFSSEGCREFALGELDFSLYNSFRSVLSSYNADNNSLVDDVIPLVELVYHGIVLYNPCSATVNYTVKEPDMAAVLALFGGRPVMYFYSSFIDPESGMLASIGTNWMGSEQLTCVTDEELKLSVAAIKRASEEYLTLCDRQKVFIESYKRLADGIAVVRYEDGVEIAANFGDCDYEYHGVSLAAHSYRVIR